MTDDDDPQPAGAPGKRTLVAPAGGFDSALADAVRRTRDLEALVADAALPAPKLAAVLAIAIEALEDALEAVRDEAAAGDETGDVARGFERMQAMIDLLVRAEPVLAAARARLVEDPEDP